MDLAGVYMAHHAVSVAASSPRLQSRFQNNRQPCSAQHQLSVLRRCEVAARHRHCYNCRLAPNLKKYRSRLSIGTLLYARRAR